MLHLIVMSSSSFITHSLGSKLLLSLSLSLCTFLLVWFLNSHKTHLGHSLRAFFNSFLRSFSIDVHFSSSFNRFEILCYFGFSLIWYCILNNLHSIHCSWDKISSLVLQEENWVWRICNPFLVNAIFVGFLLLGWV